MHGPRVHPARRRRAPAAASALSAIVSAAEGGCRETVRKSGAVPLLLGLVRQPEGPAGGRQPSGGQKERLVRFDKRDAASALLGLGVTAAELRGTGVTLAQLRAFK